MATSAGKRQREQQKLEKARAKAQRKVARQATTEPRLPDDAPHRSESELIEDLSALHLAFEAGQVSAEDFEDRRDHLQAQFEQLS